MQEKMTGKWILQGTHWQITGRYRNKQTKNKCYAVTLKRTTERTHLKLCSSIISVEHTIQIALRVSWSIWKFAVPLLKKKNLPLLHFVKCHFNYFCTIALEKQRSLWLTWHMVIQVEFNFIFLWLEQTVSLPLLIQNAIIFTPFICIICGLVSS